MVDLLIATLIVLPAGAYVLNLVRKALKNGEIALPYTAQILRRKADKKLFDTTCCILGSVGALLVGHWLWLLVQVIL